MVNDKIIACICEGSAESAIVNKLMDEGKLIFSRDDLLDNEVIRCRSASKFQEKYLFYEEDNCLSCFGFTQRRFQAT